MNKTIGNFAQTKDNNFNLIRFIAACLVLFSHSFIASTGSPASVPLKLSLGITWGGIAVDVFFITSGFLIAGSFFNKKSLLSFIWARILRIYPALIVAMLISVFLLGSWFTTLSTAEYLTTVETYKYLIKNIILFFGVNLNLPGVFTDNPYVNTVNGSLWTLPYEVKMYFYLALIGGGVGFIEKKTQVTITKNLFLLIASFSLYVFMLNYFYYEKNSNFSRLFYMFFIGATCYQYRTKLVLSHKPFLFFLLIICISSINKNIFFVSYTLMLPFIVFYLAYIPSGTIRKFNNFGDYSYGIYIYSFPIQQALISSIPNLSVGPMIFLSFLITFSFAFLSWHFIESKALKLKNKDQRIIEVLKDNTSKLKSIYSSKLKNN